MKRTRPSPTLRIVLLVAVFAIVAAACSETGGSTDTSEESSPTSTTSTSEATTTTVEIPSPSNCPEPGTTIAYTPITMESSWFADISSRIADLAAECDGVEMLEFDPAGDAVEQATGIENLVEAGATAIAIAAVDADAIRPAVEAAKAKGVFIIQHVSAVPDYDVNVGVPETVFGSMIGSVGGSWLVEAKPSQDVYRVAILNADSLGEGLLDRKAGLIAGLEGALNGAAYEIVADTEAYLEDTSLDAAAAILEANPDVDLILTVNDLGALGATAAIETAGLTPGVDVVAVGSLTERGLEAVVDGRMPGGITVPGPPHGDALAGVMFALLNGTLSPGSDLFVPPNLISGPEDAQKALDAGGF